MGQVTLKCDEGIAVLSIERPKALNALSRSVVDEIDNAVESIRGDENIRVLVIYSEGNFAAGADIKDMVECNEEEARKFVFSDTFNKIEQLEIPTIAAIEGYALGGGLELALACDLRIASEDAKVGFPETGLGIMPGAGGTIRAPRIAGEAKAKELIFLGSVIDAEEALKIGLVNKVVPKDELKAAYGKWAAKLSKGAPKALAMAKKTIAQGLAENDRVKAIEIETANFADLFNTCDQKEGMRAFIEKRKPVYKGK